MSCPTCPPDYEPPEPLHWLSEFNLIFEPALYSVTPDSNRDFQSAGDPASTSRPLRPRVNIHESEETDEITMTFELPGLKKEDVSIEILNNDLTVSGQRTIPSTLDKHGYVMQEIPFGNFSRTLALPIGTNAEDIKASMQDGVLVIRLPMYHPDLTPRKITIS